MLLLFILSPTVRVALLLDIDIENLITERATNLGLILLQPFIHHLIIDEHLKFLIMLGRDELTDLFRGHRIVVHTLERGTVDSKVAIVDHELEILAQTLGTEEKRLELENPTQPRAYISTKRAATLFQYVHTFGRKFFQTNLANILLSIAIIID